MWVENKVIIDFLSFKVKDHVKLGIFDAATGIVFSEFMNVID